MNNGRKLEAVTSDRERNQANVAADLDERNGKRQRVAHQYNGRFVAELADARVRDRLVGSNPTGRPPTIGA
jgi:hypothetical protein